MNRLDRMWRDKKTTLLQLDKMRCQADHELILAAVPKEHELLSTGSTSLFMRSGAHSLPEIPLGGVEAVLQAIQVMSNGWVLLGTRLRESKCAKKADGSPEQAREWGITEGIAWPAFCRRMANGARKLGDSESTIVRYLRVRERQTRQTAVKLWAEDDWPWGEAMNKAYTQDLAVMWTVTMQSNAFGLQVSIPGLTDRPDSQENPRKRQRADDFPPPPPRGDWDNARPAPRRGSGSQSSEPWDPPTTQLTKAMLCQAWNGKGCTAKSRDCPHHKLHRCSFQLGRGFCGSKSHGAANCPHRNDVDKNKSAKGKGKGKGKKERRTQ